MISVAPTRQVTVTRIICGVDIASSSLAARIGHDGAAATFANTQDGIAQLAAFCETHGAELVAMEATGGYEQRAFAQLSEHGLPVAIVNPRAVRQFAQSMGALEKTDAIDAGMIGWYAETRKSRPLCLAPRTQLELRARVTRLRQLTALRTAQLNQQRLVINPAIQKGFRKMLAFLAQQIEELEQAIAALIRPTPYGANSIRLSAPSRAWQTAL
jgi:transposase